MTTFITKETIQRLMKDIKEIIKHPLTDQGIYYKHDEEDMLRGYAMIVGPVDTPYFGGYYFFDISYPFDYPHNPPKVTFCTNSENIRCHPNLYICGKVCISLLNTWRGNQWTGCQTITSLLLTLCILLCKHPLTNEPSLDCQEHDMQTYDHIIEYANVKIAVCDILSKNKNLYVPFFDLFYPAVRENFIKNKKALEDFCQTKINENKVNHKLIVCDFYANSNIYIDYNTLLCNLQQFT